MPDLQASLMKMTAKLSFASNQIKVATDWKQPQGNPGAKQYDQGLENADPKISKSEVALPAPPQLFVAPTNDGMHVKQAKELSEKYEKYIDGISDAVAQSFNMNKMKAKFKDLKVAACSAIGTPGCLEWDKLESMIKSSGPNASQMETKYTKAVAKGISDKWKEFTDGVSVPGLPWYPAFVAFPGPQAAPMPNVPWPFVSCPSTGTGSIMPSALKSAMVDAFGGDKEPHHKELFGALADGFAAAVAAWIPTQMVNLVMGKGPIPTFAPPYIPVGPVVMGENISTPGHLM